MQEFMKGFYSVLDLHDLGVIVAVGLFMSVVVAGMYLCTKIYDKLTD